jgi:pimeloyl-ACP methyl ester carboxylesterase
MNLVKELLSNIGKFSNEDVMLFTEKVVKRNFQKNEILLHEGEVCKSAFYIISGEAFQFCYDDIDERLRKLVIISSVHKSEGWVTEVTDIFKIMKPEHFANSPLQTAYEAVAPDKTKWNKFVEQMIASAGEPFNLGDDNIAKITAPVLIISGDNDGMDKIELAKTYKLLGGGVAAGMQPMPKSQLAIMPNQSHVSLITQTKEIFGYLDSFLQ